ncbi:MAG: pyrroline-5-carboxylate reductase [Candidatus Omnitrophica bacterium CG22_combo_CG10-13_8_21_14_all_43_16]|nr:MAG: pyrroline-5-carboxylate reductase [Candidatus Omnitrophica bacterium CG22_combo_CG10-13_8_21_14_all_43_16]
MISIIGAGNMGRAIASGIKARVFFSDKFKCISDNITAAKRSNVVILAVKPQDMAEVLKEIAPHVKNKLIISIAAGVSTLSIEKALGKVRVVRVMPNMPAMVGKGISAITGGRFARPEDLKITFRIFAGLGEVVQVKEKMMDAVTAVSGSGPAYYFLFTHLLAASGEAQGLEKGLALKLARAAFVGAAEVASRNKNISMEEFVKKVASKGGTTEAALKVFKEKKLGLVIKKAVRSAAHRSKQLEKRR